MVKGLVAGIRTLILAFTLLLSVLYVRLGQWSSTQATGLLQTEANGNVSFPMNTPCLINSEDPVVSGNPFVWWVNPSRGSDLDKEKQHHDKKANNESRV